MHILDSGMEAAVRLSHRYLADRQLPDKAVSVLDTACARLALGQSATPGPVEDCKRILDDLALQDRVLNREQTAGADHRERLAGIAERRTQVEAQLAELEGRWLKEKDTVSKILEVRGKLVAESANADQTAADALRAEYTQAMSELEALQGENPLVRPFVDASIVGEVISGWTGIPVGKMMSDELGTMLELEAPRRACHRSGSCAGGYLASRAHVEGRHRRSEQAEGRVHARRPVRRRQDGNRTGPVRHAVRW